MREFKVINIFSSNKERVLLAVLTPEDMQGFTQAQVKAEVFGRVVMLDFNGSKEQHKVEGIEMMGVPERLIGNTIGLMIKSLNWYKLY